MRKYGTKDDTKAVVEWMDMVRLVLKNQFHKKGIYHVSVNTVYQLINDGDVPSPPKVDNPKYRRGQANVNIFRDAPYYRRTDKRVPALMPESKSRRLRLWEFQPEYDSRGCTGTTADFDTFFSDTSEW